MFEDAVPCGVFNPGTGSYSLNPPDSYEMRPDDQLLVIAEDDDTYAPMAAPVSVRTGPMPSVRVSRHAEKVLFCGWRRDMEDLVMVLDEFVRPGSELWIFCDITVQEREDRFNEGGLDPVHGLRNLKLKHEIGDTVSRKDLEQLPLETFDSILILASSPAEEKEESSAAMDSRSLATLLLIRDIQTKRMEARLQADEAAAAAPRPPAGPPPPKASSSFAQPNKLLTRMRDPTSLQCEIISEVLDTRTRNLIAETKVCDYVLSNELISMALSMVSEDATINMVLKELFTAEGNELYLRPAFYYIHPDEDLSFFEVMVRVRQRQEICIGVRYGAPRLWGCGREGAGVLLLCLRAGLSGWLRACWRLMTDAVRVTRPLRSWERDAARDHQPAGQGDAAAVVRGGHAGHPGDGGHGLRRRPPGVGGRRRAAASACSRGRRQQPAAEALHRGRRQYWRRPRQQSGQLRSPLLLLLSLPSAAALLPLRAGGCGSFFVFTVIIGVFAVNVILGIVDPAVMMPSPRCCWWWWRQEKDDATVVCAGGEKCAVTGRFRIRCCCCLLLRSPPRPLLPGGTRRLGPEGLLSAATTLVDTLRGQPRRSFTSSLSAPRFVPA